MYVFQLYLSGWVGSGYHGVKFHFQQYFSYIVAVGSEVYVHYRPELPFFWRFSRPRGGVHYVPYATLMTL
jgi:hypothetical protein